jgi:Putative Actinobacterial Holin-X, holin superfamily III
MSEQPPPIEVGQLLKQLADDAKGFAQSESTYLRAQLGERTSYAKPALLAIAVGGGVILGSAIALPIGVMMALTPLIGEAAATAAVVVIGIISGALLILWGVQRIKAALKRPENR